MSNFFIFILVSLVINIEFSKKKKPFTVIVCAILMVNLVSLLITIFSYHVLVDSSKLLNKPVFARLIADKDVVMNFRTEDPWLFAYKNMGWNTKAKQDLFIYLNNFIQPNSNLIYSLKNIDINTGGLRLKRTEYLGGILYSQIKEDKPNIFHVSPLFLRLSSLFGISKMISSVPFDNLHLLKRIKYGQPVQYMYLYDVSRKDSSIYYIPQRVESIYSFSALDEFLMKNMSEETAMVENIPSINNNQLLNIRINSMTEHYIQLYGSFDRDTYMVFRKNWYPEWEVLIDGKKVHVYKTNMIHLGFSVPKGNHVITLRYYPKYFIYGSLISTAYFIIVIVVLSLQKKQVF